MKSALNLGKGVLVIPDALGIGIEQAEYAEERYPYKLWDVETRLHVDGSVAYW